MVPAVDETAGFFHKPLIVGSEALAPQDSSHSIAFGGQALMKTRTVGSEPGGRPK